MIASIIGLIIETTEIRDFFEERLIGIVSKDEFLKTMDIDRLKELLSSTIDTIGNKKADNPTYFHNSLPNIVVEQIVSTIGDISYYNFNETIDYCYSCDEEMLKLDIDINALPKRTVRLKVVTRYWIVAPMLNNEVEHYIDYTWEVKKVPGLDKNKHFVIKLKVDDKIQNVSFDDFITENDNKVILDIKKPHKFTDSAFVEFDVTMFEYGASGNYWSYTSNYLENVSIHFSSDKALDLSGDIYGIAGNLYPASVTSHSINMVYSGLLMPGHGYFIVWQEK